MEGEEGVSGKIGFSLIDNGYLIRGDICKVKRLVDENECVGNYH